MKTHSSIALLVSLLALTAVQAAYVRPVSPKSPLAANEQATINLFKNATKSVVYITALVEVQDYFSMNVMEIPRGTGSGMIWDEQGHILTNFHVVQDLANGRGTAQVTLSDQTKWPAKLVGVAPDKDLAVLKISAPKTKLVPIPIGTSADLQVGQSTFAIGNPFGLDQTLTTGIVSALGREIQSLTGRTIQDVIQTDASINPGNSGGPLLDSSGRLIGVNTMIYSPSGASAGIGFAVPVDTVYRIVPQLMEFGKVIRPTLGITIVPDNYAQEWGIEGVMVLDVLPNSAAARAGLKGTRRNRMTGDAVMGDIILELSGEKIKDSNDLFNALERRKVGDKITLKLYRPARTVTLTLEASR